MAHHCPSCKKVVTTKCIDRGHLEHCPLHDAYNQKGRTCPSCSAGEKREQRERKKNEREGKESAANPDRDSCGPSKKHRKGGTNKRDGGGKSKPTPAESSEAPGWRPQDDDYTNTSQALHDSYAHDHTTHGYANEHQSAGTYANVDEQYGDNQHARTFSGSSSSHGASDSPHYVMPASAGSYYDGYQDDTQAQEAQSRAYRPAPSNFGQQMAVPGASAYTEDAASQEIPDYYEEDAYTQNLEADQGAYYVEDGSDLYDDSTDTGHGYN